jgi:hypothetical protein
LVIPPEQIRGAFLAALKREKENWEVVFRKGTSFKISEPEINDINKAVLAKLWITNDGDELRGGGIHYEGFWPYNAIESCKLMLDLGYFDEVRFYVEHFFKTRIEPSGLFRFDWGAWRHQIYDVGYFLHCLINYYWYTGDGTFFENYEHEVDLLVGMIERNRQLSREKFPNHDPRHGMLVANMNNDFREKSYFYSSDAPVYMGISEYAGALANFGATRKDNRLREKADELAEYAEDYFTLLRRSFESCGAIERQGDKITYIHHIPLPPEWPRPALESPYREAGSRLRAHTRFHEFPLDWPKQDC